ncbi:MAG TPA: antitoxin [Steroidobacteraceae bacterium]|nr:antitoxin [Steroidobacteraceae bacterium]
MFLVGGLTPRYLVSGRPPAIPPHAGTQDVDVVIDLQILADTEAYHTLEQNLRRLGFSRAENEKGQKLSWRWQARTERGALIVLELLADSAEIGGGKVQALPTDGTISALNIPHSSIVFDLHQVVEITAELLGSNGLATERVRHASIVSFTCLKVFAFEDRFERKDAHDLVYCIEHAPRGIDDVAESFRVERDGKHGAVIRSALEILRRRFVTSGGAEGYRKDGPIAVAKFELGEEEDPELRERRLLRQRTVSDVIERLLALIGQAADRSGRINERAAVGWN